MEARIGASIALLLLGMVAAASAEGIASGAADRQDVKQFKFTAERPGKPTGVRISATFTASGPEEGVERLVTTLARGSELDTSVPERCRASDDELVAEGADACPRRSRVGAGIIELAELGVGDITMLNGRKETIFLIEFRDAPIRTVARESVQGRNGRRQTIEITSGLTLKRVRLAIDRIEKDGEGYVETPNRCPANKRWINRGRLVYRDGVQQREQRATPCVASQPPPTRRG